MIKKFYDFINENLGATNKFRLFIKLLSNYANNNKDNIDVSFYGGAINILIILDGFSGVFESGKYETTNILFEFGIYSARRGNRGGMYLTDSLDNNENLNIIGGIDELLNLDELIDFLNNKK